MFNFISKKFQTIFSSLSGKKVLTEENISEAVREVRLALLDADVNFAVVSAFIKRVKEKFLGENVTKGIAPKDQFVKVIHDELVALMGGVEEEIHFKGYPAVMMLCGLQGSGKTTTCVKLASYLLKKGMRKKPLLVACDLARPAAIQQLKKAAEEIDVPVFTLEGVQDPVRIAKEAKKKAEKEGFDLLILDTAGRLHVDEDLMQELLQMKKCVEPHEIFFVANAATGQDAVKTAQEFDQRIEITGTILTMLDGSSRAGAAISIREVTKKPLRFEGFGETIKEFRPFNPHSAADRILGMGDVINLVRTMENSISEEETLELQKKLEKSSFTYEDYVKQMSFFKKLGPLKGLMGMLPGMPELPSMEGSEKELEKLEAMIFSMTPAERKEKVEISHGRRVRIAKGSGVSVDDVNRMVKGFKRLKSLDLAGMKKRFFKGGMPDLKSLKF